MQIYLVDYAGQIGITPFDVMKGTANKKIIIDKPITNTESLSSNVLSDNKKIIDEALKSSDPKSQEKINKLTPDQRRGLDFHLTGLYAYIQRSQIKMPDYRTSNGP